MGNSLVPESRISEEVITNASMLKLGILDLLDIRRILQLTMQRWLEREIIGPNSLLRNKCALRADCFHMAKRPKIFTDTHTNGL